jgi:copper homeostasis protein CutC
MPLLEVIALNAADAEAAERGGADRLEVVADMTADGLTPPPRVVAQIRAATTLPLRVMLRFNSGFTTNAGELDRLRGAAQELAAVSADGFVFGFLDPAGNVDMAATTRLATAVAPLPWTFHRAVDHAAPTAWRSVRELPGLDAVLSAGSPYGVDEGLDLLTRRAATDAPLMLVGGGLRRENVRVLTAAGVTAFHVGGAVRPDRRFGEPIDAALVRQWRDLIDLACPVKK